MTAKLRKAVAAYDAACIDARRRIDSQWLDARLADLTTPDTRQAEYASVKLTLAREHGIPANLI